MILIRNFLVSSHVWLKSDEYEEVLQMHWFYIYAEEKLFGFDLIVDFNSNCDQIKEEILEKLNEKYLYTHFYYCG